MPLKNILDIDCSMFTRVTDTTPKTVNLLQWLQSPEYLPQQNQVRAIDDASQQKAAKVQIMPCITPSGIFSKRGSSHLLTHTGLMAIDIDKKDNPGIKNFEALKSEICKIPNVAYCGLSVSGKGYWALIPIAYPEKHEQHFRYIETFFRSKGLIIDPACKDVARLRFYSFDPEAFFNHHPKRLERFKRPHSERPREYRSKAFATGSEPLWEQYNQSDEVFSLLENHSWRIDGKRGQKTYFTRPGKDAGTSAEYDRAKGVFYVFTSSTGFEANKGYNPFQVFAILEHGGDFSRAAKALRQERRNRR